MTVMRAATVIRLTGIKTGCKICQDAIRPTPAGINITGMISMRNMPASFTEESGTSPDNRPINRITIPYILAGIGRGSRNFSASPAKEMPRMIKNCFTNFKKIASF